MKKLHASLLLLALTGCGLVPLLLGCISFGSFNPVEQETEKTGQPKLSKLVSELRRREGTDNNNESVKEDLPQLNDAFIKTYLKEFGYLKSAVSISKSKDSEEEISRAIRNFQNFMGVVPATGKMDFQSTSHMVRKRCSNPDLLQAESMNPIWERSSLKWHLVVDDENRPLPKGFEAGDLRDMIRQAFSAWEIVISMEFLEETTNATNADIVFVFGGEEMMNNNKTAGEKAGKPHVPTATTGLGIAFGTEPIQSRIWLHRNENWSTFQVQEEGKVDIFLVLIHEIGHTLGLRHSSDKNSVMFPIFEKNTGEQLPVISNDDVERLRTLYDPAENGPDPVDEEESGTTKSNSTSESSTTSSTADYCPKALWAITQDSNEDLSIFMDINCWRFTKDRQLIGDGPKPIAEVFPGAPAYVDVAITAGNLTVLIQERTLYGYTTHPKTRQFMPVEGFPKPLHSRVLFYPEAAFPLSNGSIILLRDKVFATYNLFLNEPSMLNDKSVYFPSLPEDIRSGLLQQLGSTGMEDKTFYWIFDGEKVYTYDSNLHNILHEQSLADFLKCRADSREDDRIHPKATALLLNKA